MPYIGKNLETKEEAVAYNDNIYKCRREYSAKGYGASCIGSLACTNCYHVISDSCLCAGLLKCPKCGNKNEIKYPFKLYPFQRSSEMPSLIPLSTPFFESKEVNYPEYYI
jgi:hypothetical protein